MMVEPDGKEAIAMAKKVEEQGVHFFITEDGKPRYFIRLTFQFFKDGKGWSAMCAELTTGTSYCDSAAEARDQLLDLVQLHLDGTADVMDLNDWLTSRGVALYPIPELIRLENNGTAALAEVAFRKLEVISQAANHLRAKYG